MTDPIRRVIGNLFGHPLVEQVRAERLQDERIEEAIAFEVTFIANAHGVDPVWYAQWLGPLVDTMADTSHVPPLEYAVRCYVGNWRGCA